MSGQTHARTPWNAADFMGYGASIALGNLALLVFLGSMVESEFLLFVGWSIAAVGGAMFQIGAIAKAVQIGMTATTLD